MPVADPTSEKYNMHIEEGSEDEAMKEARWKFWKRSNSSSRRGSMDEEASVGDEEPTLASAVCAPANPPAPIIAPIIVCEPAETI